MQFYKIKLLAKDRGWRMKTLYIVKRQLVQSHEASCDIFGRNFEDTKYTGDRRMLNMPVGDAFQVPKT